MSRKLRRVLLLASLLGVVCVTATPATASADTCVVPQEGLETTACTCEVEGAGAPAIFHGTCTIDGKEYDCTSVELGRWLCRPKGPQSPTAPPVPNPTEECWCPPWGHGSSRADGVCGGVV